MSKPAQGWPAPLSAAGKALGIIGLERRVILKSRGLLALRIPARPQSSEGQFRWITDPICSHELDAATWHFDGSMLNGKWKPLRITGFGIAVVSAEGSLIGHGLGWPPNWVATAAAAEA